MLGLMMDQPLLISSLARHAEAMHYPQEIVSVTYDNPRHRYTYGDAFVRVRKLANALAKLGLEPGDRVATLAWNDYRHFELYFAVPGSGYVCHTINPRLFPEQLTYIMNHAEDRVLFMDPMFVPLIEGLAGHLPSFERIILLTDDKHMPETTLPNAQSYESFIEDESDAFVWPLFDENTASGLCYTSGTTGNPKGVLYSNRSTVLHSYGASLPDALGFSSRETILPIVPMFHVNAWGMPFAAAMTGPKIVFPGPKMGDPETLHELITTEGVTLSAGVPTVFQGLVNYLAEHKLTVDCLQRVLVGGSALPTSLAAQLRDDFDVRAIHAWGMTETSPLGTVNQPVPYLEHESDAAQAAARASAGRQIFGVELKITDDEGNLVPHDGESSGSLKIRGPWVAASYFKSDSTEAFADEGWFETGDIASISPLGYMQIRDRQKDLIKSGGEWISSIDLENAAVAHLEILQAAAIAIPHEKWQERPMLVVVRQPDSQLTGSEVLHFLEDKVAKWWLPDEIAFVDSIPLTATGKISKLTLRQMYEAGHLTGMPSD